MADHHVEPILRLPRVKDTSGNSGSTIYLRIAQGLWPKPVSLGPRAVGWPAREVTAINAARIAGRSDDDIRALVASLESGRRVADGTRRSGDSVGETKDPHE